jgi:hypothetical protein
MAGIGIVAAVVGGMLLYRHFGIEPRHWGTTCSGTDASFNCVPRAALLWLQHWWLWGGAALAAGFAAFLGAPHTVRVAAVALGIVAVINYNATWGMLGAALGAWAWIGDRSVTRSAGGAAAG